MRDPLLRSTGILTALFHQSAIVTEADGDRVFYGEMNRRLLLDKSMNSLKDNVFLHAQNKDTIHRIVRPLRLLGIPTAAIVDLDVVEQGGTKWTQLLDACQVPQNRRNDLANDRAAIAASYPPGKGKDRTLLQQGLSYLDSDPIMRSRAAHLLEELEKYGLFIVPGGAMESWLPQYGSNAHGSNWLTNLFDQIGQHEGDSNFLRPTNTDVWAFMSRIAKWVNDPHRLGVV
jgi:hypothetical protein